MSTNMALPVRRGIMSEINGLPMVNMFGTFEDCVNLTTPPTIPNTVTSMAHTFANCTSLKKAPEIPSSVNDLSYTFQESYKSYLEMMALGCKYCGDTNCAAFYARAETGYTHYDYTKCPYYDEKYDPSIYCQECGHKKLGKCEPGETGCTTLVKGSQPCWNCGEMVYANQCHNCVKKEK